MQAMDTSHDTKRAQDHIDAGSSFDIVYNHSTQHTDESEMLHVVSSRVAVDRSVLQHHSARQRVRQLFKRPE
jgi:hypothetical protein